MLAFSLSLPLLVLSLTGQPHGALLRWFSLIISCAAAPLLCLHAGLSAQIVIDIDAGNWVSKDTVNAALGVFLAALGVPAGLNIAMHRNPPRMTACVAIPAVSGALSQIVWFGIYRLLEGASGIDFWFWSRVLIHTATGLVAGLVAGGARIYSPAVYPKYWGGLSSLLAFRLPSALPICIVLTLGLTAAGAARIAAETSDSKRFITQRFDDYFLALSNLRRARSAGLVYAGLLEDLEKSGRALLGAAAFDAELSAQLKKLLEYIEGGRENEQNNNSFRKTTLAVNRHMLAIGEPFFLEPHVINEDKRSLRFVLRYEVTGSTRLRLLGGPSVPVLRLRRMDDILVDTPYTGLSYKGIGTILMDHIDDVALRSYGRLFTAGATEKDSSDGRFAVTRMLLRKDRKRALELALASRGHRDPRTFERLAAFGERWSQVADVSGVRAEMDADVRAVYDSLAEILATQTEIHEARHAFDGEWKGTLPVLVELSAKHLSSSAAAETRAYLTEIIDGPLGPRFGLSTACRMIAGPSARANAYFFASVVIMEGLWGEKIRRPDVVERESQSGPKKIVAPISRENPGWLSYSRIHGAYSDLRALSPDELRVRARILFEQLFEEEYPPIAR